MELSKKIYQLRKLAGMTQEQFYACAILWRTERKELEEGRK